MLITGILMTKEEIQHTSPFRTWVEEWSFSPRWRWVSLMPLSKTLVQASASAWHGGKLGLKLHLWAPKSGWISSLEKSAFMSMRRSSASVTSLEAPLPIASLHCEEAPLETILYSEEALAVLTEHCLLDWVSIGILPVGLGSSPLQSKWLCRTWAALLPAEAVSPSEPVLGLP